ncbi:MAG: hypothetical protein AAGA27_06890 [Pseudomonadota bacterium]
MTVGEIAAHYERKLDYEHWGLAGSLRQLAHQKQFGQAEALQLLARYCQDNDEFCLVSEQAVPYYQGAPLPSREVTLLRFQRKNNTPITLGGEHISIVYDHNTNQLLGLTRMLSQLDGSDSISHQLALDTALKFLQTHAPDLLSTSIQAVQLVKLPASKRIVFSPGLVFDKVTVNWIDYHKETILVNNQVVEIYGMEVKLYIPEQSLWAWVIVDNYGQVLTFERNIAWDFDRMRRQTQMWLHDAWLKQHHFNFTPI